MHASIHDTRNTDAIILSKSKASATLLTNGKDDDVSTIILIYFLSLHLDGKVKFSVSFCLVYFVVIYQA